MARQSRRMADNSSSDIAPKARAKTGATPAGVAAIALWSLLALFTVASAPVPPMQLTAMAFLVGTLPGLAWTARSGGFGQLRRLGWKVWAFGTAGLFGYHALYFSALRHAPPAEAGLIAYLWPLLIVLFSGLLPGERLAPGQVFGALMGFAGAALLISGGAAGFRAGAITGYLLALAAAFTWSGYSVLSRRLAGVPTAAVTIFCLMTALLSGAAHLLWEPTIWPETLLGWLAILALGLGPVGMAFYLWDIGVKHGDIQLLGVAAYGAPLLSTLILIGAGLAEPGPVLFAAAFLITAGALLAARSSFSSKSAVKTGR